MECRVNVAGGTPKSIDHQGRSNSRTCSTQLIADQHLWLRRWRFFALQFKCSGVWFVLLVEMQYCIWSQLLTSEFCFTLCATRVGLDLSLDDSLLKGVILVPRLDLFVGTRSLLISRLILVNDSPSTEWMRASCSPYMVPQFLILQDQCPGTFLGLIGWDASFWNECELPVVSLWWPGFFFFRISVFGLGQLRC